MVKKKPHSEPHEEHADETWLIPYSDLLTLLLALFIVLFASSSLDKAKMGQMEYVFAAAFHTLSADQMNGSVLNFLEDAKDLKLGDNVGLGSDPNGAVLDIAGLFLFDEGSAVIKPDGVEALRKIAALLNSYKYKRYRIMVEGHTDKALMWFDRCYLGFANCYKWKGKAVLAALKLLAAQDRKAEARVICDEFINDAKNKASPDYEAVKQYRLVL